jgi:hypothetical protein
MELAKGPMSKEDKAFISESAGKMNPSDIAKAINRNPKSIIKYMKENGLMKNYISSYYSNNSLSKTPYWHELIKQFDEEELKLFEYHWEKVISQFQQDILHTEELQVLDMIKMEILANRSLSNQSQIKQQIDTLRQEIMTLKLSKDKDYDKIESREAQIAALYSTYETLGKDYSNLLKEKSNIFKALKVTREQRYKQIENSKESLIDWIKNIIENKEKRHEAGVHMEKMRLATKEEYIRLSEYHTYADGTVEKPILNSETVFDEDIIDGKVIKDE